MRERKKVIFLTLGFLIGVSMIFYPAFSNYWNTKLQTRTVVEYESVIEELEPEDYTALFDAAHDYNKALYETDLPFHDYKDIPGYLDMLKVEGTSIMGYVTIDRIGVELPIYHGTSEEVLNNGVGHLEGSSLPVGGENTHCVLSAHRALPSVKLFTDLDRVEIGDTFELTILDQVFTYQVDQIEVVIPRNIDNLQIEPGKDYCTLFTCTPYGINTHRLLVRGVRIETITDKPVIYVANEVFRVDPLLVTPAVAAPMLLILFIYLMVKYRKPQKRKEESDDKEKKVN